MTHADSPSPSVIRFGDFALHQSPPALFRAGRRVNIQRQPLRLLTLLASRRGAIVSHEEIRQALWQGRFVDFQRGTHVCIRQVRAALGEHASAHRFIESVAGEGYRFVAAIHAEPQASGPKPFVRQIRTFIPAAAMLATAVVAIFGAVAGSNKAPAPAAVDAYSRGAFVLAQGGEEAAQRSIGFFERAIQLDANYADPYLAAAQAHLQLGDCEEAARMARAALDHDPSLAEAHVVLGRALMTGDWDWRSARRHFARAVVLEPNLASAHHGLASTALLLGDVDTAMGHMARALRLDPASTLIKGDYGWMQMAAGRPDLAIQSCSEALALDSASLEARACLIRAYALIGRQDEVIAQASAIMSAANATPRDLALVAAAGAEASLAFERWRLARYERAGRTDVSPTLLASLHAYVGDHEGALDLLDQSLEGRDKLLPFALIDPAFAPLADEPRFRRIVRELGIRPLYA